MSVMDITDATFGAEVVERSRRTPVLVDLWAPWCGPCRQLSPILEEVVGKTAGQVVLAKVNVDENPQVAATFRVQGIPAVFALKDGKVVDSFVGAQGEPAVRAFVDRLLPSPEESKVAELVASGDEGSLRAALEIQADHPDAVVKLAELLAGKGEGAADENGANDEALALLGRIPETAETRRVAALVRTGGNGVGADEITAKLDDLLDLVKQDDAARQEFVDLLEVLGPDDPRTTAYRKQLSARLF